MSPAKREQIIAYYVAGYSIFRIAAAVGCTMAEVRAALTEKEK